MNITMLLHRKFVWVGLLLLLPATPAPAYTIQELLAAAAHHPNVEVSELSAREGVLREEQASAALYPKANLFGRAEIYNSPTNLRPMPPTEVNFQAGDSLPFSREILRYGLSVETPLYVAKIYRLREKLQILAEKSAIASRINLVSRQAAVVALNSGYTYLLQLRAALESRRASLTKTRDDLRLKVENGRTPEAELLKIDNSLIGLAQQENALAQRILDLQRDLQKFTGLEVTTPAPMALVEPPSGSELIGLKLEETELAGQQKELERARAGHYPTLSLYGTLSGNDGRAYNTDEHIFRPYNFAGIVLSVPIYDRTIGAEERLAELSERKAERKVADTRIELTALEQDLKARLPVVEAGLELAERARDNNQQLLDIARHSFELGRTTTEEYLRYEAQMLDSQANIAKARDENWQILTKQSVLYGLDLKGIVK